ncbi:MAG: cation diffusion facilitator CzcD-associated flavoprotein CzcO [Gammaproteobacteria bacterium]
MKADYPALREKARGRPTGIYFPFNTSSALEATHADRTHQYEEFWARGGLPFLGAYGDLLFDKAANDTIAQFARAKIRALVHTSATAELLCPDNIFGCKRLCVDSGYYQTFNAPHVSLVDISNAPIDRFTPRGISTNGAHYELDTVVCATGFATMTESFDRIDIRGRGGLTLVDKWRAGPRTYLGLSTAGVPNLFMITGPSSPSVLASMIQSIEQHVDWMADCIGHLRDIGADTIEATLTAEDEWVDHVNEVAAVSLRSTCSSGYVGANVPGRPRVFMPYIEGFPVYVAKCNEVMSQGFEGFTLQADVSGAPDSSASPQIRLTKRWRVPLDTSVVSPPAIAAQRVPIV